MKHITGVMFLALLAFELASADETTVSTKSWEHFMLVNDLRSVGFTCPGGRSYAANSVPLKFDCRLWRASKLHSEDMADNSFFSHTSLDGRSPWERASAQGLSANGENIAAGGSSAAAALEQWKKSDGHCNNIMNSKFKVFAVGYGYGPSSPHKHYWTQMFRTSLTDLDTSCYQETSSSGTSSLSPSPFPSPAIAVTTTPASATAAATTIARTEGKGAITTVCPAPADGSRGPCETCFHGDQCQQGFYCCPFMRKCVSSSSMACRYPVAMCRTPTCYDRSCDKASGCDCPGCDNVGPGRTFDWLTWANLQNSNSGGTPDILECNDQTSIIITTTLSKLATTHAKTMTTTHAAVHASASTTTTDASTTFTESTTTASRSETNGTSASTDVVQGQLHLEVLNPTEFVSAPVELPLAESLAQIAKVDISTVSLRVAVMSRRLGARNSSAGMVRVTYTVRATKATTMDIANGLNAMNLSAVASIISQNLGKAGLEHFSVEVFALSASVWDVPLPEEANDTELSWLFVLEVGILSTAFAATIIVAIVCWRKCGVREQPEEPIPDGNVVGLPTLFNGSGHLGKLCTPANQVVDEELIDTREVDIEGLSDPVIISRV